MVFLINLLTAIFAGLKLSNVISWSWWIVLSPTIFTIGVIVFSGIIMYVTLIVRRTIEIDKDALRMKELKELKELKKSWDELQSKE